ncbi:MAG: hypothetical protein KQJ78_14670 [Deltaproteobacteria bacterium]|nr:hypothetical protein [Deltaproteobacteria bacterium]
MSGESRREPPWKGLSLADILEMLAELDPEDPYYPDQVLALEAELTLNQRDRQKREARDGIRPPFCASEVEPLQPHTWRTGRYLPLRGLRKSPDDWAVAEGAA